MADLTGSTILKDSDNETVLSVPKNSQVPEARTPAQVSDEEINQAAASMAPEVAAAMPVAEQAPVVPSIEVAPAPVPAVPSVGIATAPPVQDFKSLEDEKLALESQGAAEKLQAAEDAAAVTAQYHQDVAAVDEAQAQQYTAMANDITAKLKAEEEKKEKISEHLMNNPETKAVVTRNLGDRIIYGVAAFLGGLGQGPNQVLSMINSQLDRNLEKEKMESADKKNLYATLMKQFGNTAAATSAWKEINLKAIEKTADAARERAKSPLQQAKALELKANIRDSLLKERAKLREDTVKNLETQRKEMFDRGLTDAPAGGYVDRSMLKNTRDVERSVVNPVDNTKVALAPSKEQAIKFQDSMSKTKDAIKALGEIAAFRKKNANIAWSKLPSTERGRIQATATSLLSASKLLSDFGVLQAGDMEQINNFFAISDYDKVWPVIDGRLSSAEGILRRRAIDQMEQLGLPKDPRYFDPRLRGGKK